MIKRKYWIRLEVKHKDGGGHFECSNTFTHKGFLSNPQEVLDFAIERFKESALKWSKEELDIENYFVKAFNRI